MAPSRRGDVPCFVSLLLAAALLASLAPNAHGACPAGGSTDRCGESAKDQYGSACSCRSGLCCSRFGYCGPTSASSDPASYFCGSGCQRAYGTCTTPPSCPAGGSNDFCGVDGSGLPKGGFDTPCKCAGTQCCSQYGFCQPSGQCQVPGCQAGYGTCPSSPGSPVPTTPAPPKAATPPGSSSPAPGSTSPPGSTAPPTGSTTPPPSTSTTPPAPWLYVEGASIKVGGTPWFARGVNLPDPRSCGACSKNNAGGASYQQLTDEAIRRATAAVRDWKAQVLRVGVYTDPTAGDTSPSTDGSYLSSLTSLVNHATNQLGVYVMLAVWVDPANSVSSSNNLTNLNVPNDAMVALWQKLAVPFAANPRVLFAITNEPHCPRGSDSLCASDHDAQVRAGMTKVVQAIRAVERSSSAPYPHIIVAQGCRGYAFNVNCYVGNRLPDPQVAYESHVYTGDYSTLLNAASSLPLIVGELGPKNSKAACYSELTFDSLRSLILTLEQRRIPYLGWTFHQACEPSLLRDDAGRNNRCGLGMTLAPADDNFGSSGSPDVNCGSNVQWGCFFNRVLTSGGTVVPEGPGARSCGIVYPTG